MSENSNRPEWDEYFLNIAREVGKRSTCLRRHYGAIIVKDKIKKRRKKNNNKLKKQKKRLMKELKK